MQESGFERFTYGQFLRAYFLLLVILVALAALFQRWLGIDYYRTVVVVGGLVFWLASAGRPARLYRVVRNTGWFALIRDELVMRWLLVSIGALAIIAGLFLPASQLHR